MNPRGYGRFRLAGRSGYAHQAGYILHVGPVPNGLELDHTCRNTRCVNPAHLEPVTHVENARRRRWARTHCIHGHAYTAENTFIRSTDRGKRCRTCIAAASRRYAARRKETAA